MKKHQTLKMTQQQTLEVPYQQGIINELHRQLPADHQDVLGDIDEEAISELWLIHQKLKRSFRPSKNGRSFDSYFYEWAGKKLLEYFMDEPSGLYQQKKNLVSLNDILTEEIQKDEKDGHQHHKYGKWEEPAERSIYDKLEENDELALIESVANRIGLKNVLPMMLAGRSERDIAKRLKMPRGTLHKRIVKLKKLVREIFFENEGAKIGKAA